MKIKQRVSSIQLAQPKQRGFTLLEIMVVVVILGILGAAVVPQFMSAPDKAKLQSTKNDLKQISSALEMYRLDNGQYPSSEQGLEALITKPSGFPEPRNYDPEGYLKRKEAPTDPYGSPYIYERDGRNFTLFSLGDDGEEGGEGYGADIFVDDL